MWSITPTRLLKKYLICLSIFKIYFMKSFGAVKASLVYIKNRCRSSRSQMFSKIGVLKKLAMFTRKHLCWSLFLIKLQTFRCFPVNIAKLLRAAFLYNTPGGCFCKCSVWHYIFKKTLLNIRCTTRCHSFYHSLSLVVPLVVTRCTTRCRSLSFVVHSLSFTVTWYTTRLPFYKRS